MTEAKSDYSPRIKSLIENRDNIFDKMERGTVRIKEGHRIKGINPDGKAMEIPLSPRKMRRLDENLRSVITQIIKDPS